MSGDILGSFYYIIPAEVMHDKDLCLEEKMIYAFISGLANKKGYCFASNQWFCEEMGLKERKFQIHIAALEKWGYIRREIIPDSKNPFKKERRIYITAKFKKCLPDAPGCTLEPEPGCAIDMNPGAPIISEGILISEYNPLTPPCGGEAPNGASVPSRRKRLNEEHFSRADRVATTPSQHETLLKKAGGSADLVKRWYEELSTWKIGRGMDGGRNDFKAIVDWVIRKVETDVKISPVSEKKSDWLSKVKERLKDVNEIAFGPKGISFSFGQGHTLLEYSEPDFREQLFFRLRNMKISTEDL